MMFSRMTNNDKNNMMRIRNKVEMVVVSTAYVRFLLCYEYTASASASSGPSPVSKTTTIPSTNTTNNIKNSNTIDEYTCDSSNRTKCGISNRTNNTSVQTITTNTTTISMKNTTSNTTKERVSCKVVVKLFYVPNVMSKGKNKIVCKSNTIFPDWFVFIIHQALIRIYYTPGRNRRRK